MGANYSVLGPYIYQLQIAARQVDMLQVAGILSLVTVRHVLKLPQPVAPHKEGPADMGVCILGGGVGERKPLRDVRQT